MKLRTLKRTLIGFAIAASPMLPTSCSSVRHVERVSASGWIVLQKGETFKAPHDMVLAEEYVVLELQQELMDLIQAVNQYGVQQDLNMN